MLFKNFRAAASSALLLSACFLNSCQSYPDKADANKSEIIYHVAQRSFYDSNGDLHGDLNGLREKLDYLQDLGVTSILMLPLYESVYYHNYFSSDFEKIDPEFGTMKDYLDLVKAIHNRGMKLYIDMETQYVTEDHVWYKDSFGNPKSPYSDYILYDDSLQTKPSTIVFEVTGLKGFDGTEKRITTVNLKSKKVLEYNYKLFKYFADPNGDGNFDDGVDGFRLDHAMDTLDNKPRLAGLFEAFWKPLITRLKEVNPKLKFIAEQANWNSFGIDYLTKANVDAVFAFKLSTAIRNLNRDAIMAMADSTFAITPADKDQIVFIENHDMPRFAQLVGKNLAKEKIGAALNILTGGTPSIYYGQEIGMVSGTTPDGYYGANDANHIPYREAFEWYKGETGEGMALWYKDTGPWWNNRNMKPNDGISYEEQRKNPESLFNFYKKLNAYYRRETAINNGAYQNLQSNNKNVVTFLRYNKINAVIVAVNLSGSTQSVNITTKNSLAPIVGKKLNAIFDDVEATFRNDNVQFNLPAYGIEVFDIN